MLHGASLRKVRAPLLAPDRQRCPRGFGGSGFYLSRGGPLGGTCM